MALLGATSCAPRASLRSGWLPVLFRSSVSSPTFSVPALPAAKRGTLKLPAEIVDLSGFPFNAVIDGFAYFEGVSLGTGNLRIASPPPHDEGQTRGPLTTVAWPLHVCSSAVTVLLLCAKQSFILAFTLNVILGLVPVATNGEDPQVRRVGCGRLCTPLLEQPRAAARTRYDESSHRHSRGRAESRPGPRPAWLRVRCAWGRAEDGWGRSHVRPPSGGGHWVSTANFLSLRTGAVVSRGNS